MAGGDQKQKQQQRQGGGGGKQGGGKKNAAELLEEQMEPPQAIMIADPFCECFESVVPTPPVLMPLASSRTPLMDNTLCMLKRAQAHGL